MSDTPPIYVQQVMTRNVKLIGQDREIHELEKMLLRDGVHGVPVVDEQRRIVGVVSQTDLLAWHFEAEGNGGTTRVAEVMSPLVHCIGPDRPLAEAAGRMVRERIHRLIVVDEQYSVVGIISATDLLLVVPGVDRYLGATA